MLQTQFKPGILSEEKVLSSPSFELPNPKPFIKWAGGKTQLLPEIIKRIPNFDGRYYEPFLGGGALFFFLNTKSYYIKPAYISDINADLIASYEVVRDSVDKLIDSLNKHKNKHSQHYFYELRYEDRKSSYKKWDKIQKASRLIYLNKTCYNGLYRVNSKGQFNVPMGKYKNPSIINEKNLRACSQALQNTEIVNASFEKIRDVAQKGDFVYFDPPYVPLNSSSSFTQYSQNGFNLERQKELRDLCVELHRNGVKFMVSNSDCKTVKDLYSNQFKIELVEANRFINSKGNKRGKLKEVIVRNYA